MTWNQAIYRVKRQCFQLFEQKSSGDLCDSVDHCFLELSQGKAFSVQPRGTPQLGERFSEKEVIETAKRSCPWDVVVRKVGLQYEPHLSVGFLLPSQLLAKCLPEAQISTLAQPLCEYIVCMA